MKILPWHKEILRSLGMITKTESEKGVFMGGKTKEVKLVKIINVHHIVINLVEGSKFKCIMVRANTIEGAIHKAKVYYPKHDVVSAHSETDLEYIE